MMRASGLVREIEANAFEQIGRAEPVDVLILSDRYPPDVAGGAEISLHQVLSRIAGRVRLAVVTFTAAIEACGWESIGGVRVLSLPRAAAWPLQAWPAAATSEIHGWGHIEKGLALAACTARGIVSPEYGAIERMHGLATWLAGPSRDLTLDYASFPAAWHLRLLHRAADVLRPRLVHADNLHSILAANEAFMGRGARLVGQVRDNRFLCARKDQDSRIGGIPCSGCAVGCVPADAARRHAVVRSMERTRDFRRARLRGLDRIIVASRYLERQVGLIAPDVPLSRIENPVEDADEVTKWIRAAPTLPGTSIAVVGTLREGKGQAALLRRMPQIARLVPDVRLHVAGRGPDESGLRRLAADLGMTERTTFHGQLDRHHLFRLLSGCRVVAVPSLWPEPFGRVPLEAALVERPVVAFATGGLRETVENEVTGLLVEAGDFDGFATAIVRLALDQRLGVKFAAAAKKKVLANHHPAKVAEQVLAVWQRELDRPEDYATRV